MVEADGDDDDGGWDGAGIKMTRKQKNENAAQTKREECLDAMQ
jgi:hypothetical protein